MLFLPKIGNMNAYGIHKLIREKMEQSSLKGAYARQAYEIIDIIQYHSLKKSGIMGIYIPIPKRYWEKVVGYRYFKPLRWLINNDIIKVDNRYSIKGKKVKSYGIQLYTFHGVRFGATPLPHPVPSKCCTLSSFEKVKASNPLSVKDLGSLILNPKNLVQNLDEVSLPIVKEDDWEEGTKGLFYSLHKPQFWGDVRKTIREKESEGFVVAKIGKGFIWGKHDELLEHRKITKRLTYITSLEQMLDKKFYAHRNNTNRRLDTNVTNMPTELFREVQRQNDLVQIDLKNSQFAILSSLLPDEPGYQEFKSLTNSGELYTFLKEKLGLVNRESAKNHIFVLAFGRVESRAREKARLREIFPEVVKWVDDKKIELGCHREFAIMLQKIESKIFIDNIYRKIKDNKKFCLTKHDSIIVRRKDIDYAITRTRKSLQQEGIEGQLRVESFSEGLLEFSTVEI